MLLKDDLNILKELKKKKKNGQIRLAIQFKGIEKSLNNFYDLIEGNDITIAFDGKGSVYIVDGFENFTPIKEGDYVLFINGELVNYSEDYIKKHYKILK